MPPRPYRQTRRAQSADATRLRIVEAARDQLLSGDELTIDAVARGAGVSRVSVYHHFVDRDGLREAVYDQLAMTGGLGAIPQIFAEADPLEGLTLLVATFCEFYATHRRVLRRLNALAALAKDTGALPDGRNERRRHMLDLLLERIAQLPEHQSMDVEQAATTLQALTSFEFADRLAGEASMDAALAGRIQSLAVAALDLCGRR